MNEHAEVPGDSAADPAPIPPILALSLGIPLVAVILWFILQFWTPRRGAPPVTPDE